MAVTRKTSKEHDQKIANLLFSDIYSAYRNKFLENKTRNEIY